MWLANFIGHQAGNFCPGRQLRQLLHWVAQKELLC